MRLSEILRVQTIAHMMYEKMRSRTGRNSEHVPGHSSKAGEAASKSTLTYSCEHAAWAISPYGYIAA